MNEKELYLEDGGGIDFIHLAQDGNGKDTKLEIGYGCTITFSEYGTVHEIVKSLSEKLWLQEDK